MNDFVMQGVFDITNVVRYFGIQLTYCQNDDPSYCASFEDISKYDGYYFYVDFLNSYFDADDYSHPVKEYIDNKLYDYFTFGYSKMYDVYLSNNKALTKDSPLSISGDVTEYSFVTVDQIHSYFDDSTQNLILL